MNILQDIKINYINACSPVVKDNLIKLIFAYYILYEIDAINNTIDSKYNNLLTKLNTFNSYCNFMQDSLYNVH